MHTSSRPAASPTACVSRREAPPRTDHDRYEAWIDLDETEFKLESVYWAGAHFQHGMLVVWRKSLNGHAMATLFIVEIIMFLAWIASDA